MGNVGHMTCQLRGFSSHLGVQDGFKGQREARFWGDEVSEHRIKLNVIILFKHLEALNNILKSIHPVRCRNFNWFNFIQFAKETKRASSMRLARRSPRSRLAQCYGVLLPCFVVVLLQLRVVHSPQERRLCSLTSYSNIKPLFDPLYSPC